MRKIRERKIWVDHPTNKNLRIEIEGTQYELAGETKQELIEAGITHVRHMSDQCGWNNLENMRVDHNGRACQRGEFGALGFNGISTTMTFTYGFGA